MSSSFSAFATSASFPSKDSSMAAKNPMYVGEVPTFHPTREELCNFTTYISDCGRNSKDYGMCRIVPPDGWKVVNSLSIDCVLIQICLLWLLDFYQVWLLECAMC